MNSKAILFFFLVTLLAAGNAAGMGKNKFSIDNNGIIRAGDLVFNNFSEYVNSDYFKKTGKRCLLKRRPQGDISGDRAVKEDCTLARTVIQQEYWPSRIIYTIPVVFHIIYSTEGQGNIADQKIHDQIKVLNEDFRAMKGTMGREGYDSRIQFELVKITRTENDDWFNDLDETGFKKALGWDQTKYFNIYINSASGYLGYSYLPQDSAGTTEDGVVMLYESIGGRNNGFEEYDQGRTLVHETGHYLGLYHPFEGYGCHDGYEAGDLIADTNSEDDAHYGCTQTNSCDTPDNIHNYMNYTDDSCMSEFTREQANRAVCSLINYRPSLYKQTVQSLIWPVLRLLLD